MREKIKMLCNCFAWCSGHRFAGDDESADVLLGSDWREVEKIYLRHRDDTVAVKRGVALECLNLFLLVALLQLDCLSKYMSCGRLCCTAVMQPSNNLLVATVCLLPVAQQLFCCGFSFSWSQLH